jgi:hypothetical protein
METHMGEETRYQEKGRHPEHVNGKEQHGERRTGMTVLDNPKPGGRWNERQGRVQDNAEQQGEPSDRVERVQPFRCGRTLAKLRHRIPRCRSSSDCKLPALRQKRSPAVNQKSSSFSLEYSAS